MQLWKTKIYFASVKFDAWAKRDNNDSTEMNVLPVSHTIFFLRGVQKMDIFATHGEIKSTLWPDSRKMVMLVLQGAIKCTLWPANRKIYLMQLGRKCIICECEIWCLSKARATITRSKINVFHVSHTFFFYEGGKK